MKKRPLHDPDRPGGGAVVASAQTLADLQIVAEAFESALRERGSRGRVVSDATLMPRALAADRQLPVVIWWS